MQTPDLIAAAIALLEVARQQHSDGSPYTDLDPRTVDAQLCSAMGHLTSALAGMVGTREAGQLRTGATLPMLLGLQLEQVLGEPGKWMAWRDGGAQGYGTTPAMALLTYFRQASAVAA